MNILRLWISLLVLLFLGACGQDGVVPSYDVGGASTIVGNIAATSAPVASVSLSITGAASSVAVVTDTLGSYKSLPLVPGGYTVTPSLTGYTFNPINRQLTVTKNGQVTADFVAVKGKYIVSGVVSGDIKQGVSLMMYDSNNILLGSVQTDANGIFSFSNIGAGVYTLIPSSSGYSFTPVNTPVTVANGNVTGISFTTTYNPNGSAVSNIVSGTIAGALPSGVLLTLYNSNGVALNTATTDVNGIYSFTVTSNGSFTVFPNRTGYTFTPGSTVVSLNTSNALGINFVSVAGSTSSLYSIAGSMSGAINGGVTISLYDSSNVFLKSAVTDQNGFYNFTGLAGATYNVIPALAGFSFSPAAPAVTITTANISNNNYVATKLLHTISGVVGGAPYSTVTLVGPSTAQTTIANAAGSYSFQVFLPGTYTVTPSKSGYGYVQTSLVVAYSNADIGGVNFTGTFIPSISNNAVHGSVSYSCAGATLTIPANVNTVQFEASGGDGGPSSANGLQGGGGGGASMAYDYTAGQWLFFIGGGGGGGVGIPGRSQPGGIGGTLSTFALAGKTLVSCGSTNGIAGSTYTGGNGGMGGPFNENNYGGIGGAGFGSGRGGNGGTFHGFYTACAFFTAAQGSTRLSQGCPGHGGIASSITANTGRGGDGGYSGYSSGGGGGGGYGGGGGGAGGGNNGSGCEQGGSGGGGGNYVLPGAIINGNIVMFNIDLSNHIIGIMGAPGGLSAEQNAQCGTVTASW